MTLWRAIWTNRPEDGLHGNLSCAEDAENKGWENYILYKY